MMEGYYIPTEQHRVEIIVNKSRFVATTGHIATVDEAKAFLVRIRQEMPDASHHVYAYRVGYGNSVIEGLSDDGEPTGTSGPPAMAVLRGHDIGDVIVVVTRYFGGRKLGKGGLVRAYGNAVREVLAGLPTTLKIDKVSVVANLPYSYYEPIRDLITQHQGVITAETFAEYVTLTAKLPRQNLETFHKQVQDVSLGTVVFTPEPS